MREYEFHGCADGNVFTFKQKDAEIRETIALGSINVDFNEDGDIVGFEIFADADEIIMDHFINQGSCDEPATMNVRLEMPENWVLKITGGEEE